MVGTSIEKIQAEIEAVDARLTVVMEDLARLGEVGMAARIKGDDPRQIKRIRAQEKGREEEARSLRLRREALQKQLAAERQALQAAGLGGPAMKGLAEALEAGAAVAGDLVDFLKTGLARSRKLDAGLDVAREKERRLFAESGRELSPEAPRLRDTGKLSLAVRKIRALLEDLTPRAPAIAKGLAADAKAVGKLAKKSK